VSILSILDVKVPIFLDFVDNFPEFSAMSLLYFPILCKLDIYTVCISAPVIEHLKDSTTS